MYQIGEMVVYGMHGVCEVVDTEQCVVDRKQVSYLVLEPIGQPGSRFLVPTHNEAAMRKLRPMLDKEALEALLVSQKVHADAWIKDENLRKQCYREQITAGDREKLLQLVCSLYRFRSSQAAAGRKIHMCDENFLRDAEKQLTSEISIVLEMENNEALKYLRNKLKEDA